MKKILVASDFSESAANAFGYALSLANSLHMEIAVIHAIHPTEGMNNNMYNAIFIEHYYDKKRSALKEWADKISRDSNYVDVKIETVCDVGFLRNVVSQYVEYHSVSFLVMGMTGATGIKGIIGGNASMMVSKIRIPTLIVPLETTLSPDPVVTLATDYKTARFSVRDVKALTQILKISKPRKLHVLHISEKDMDSIAIKEGEKKLMDMIPSAEFSFNYVDDDVKTSSGIIDFIEKNETDILCLVKRNHNIIYRIFAGSTVNKVLSKSVKAVLVLHD